MPQLVLRVLFVLACLVFPLLAAPASARPHKQKVYGASQTQPHQARYTYRKITRNRPFAHRGRGDARRSTRARGSRHVARHVSRTQRLQRASGYRRARLVRTVRQSRTIRQQRSVNSRAPFVYQDRRAASPRRVVSSPRTFEYRDVTHRGAPRADSAQITKLGTAFIKEVGSALGLVSEARRFIGTNPTGRKNLWCARFMNLVLKRTGRKGTGSDMARSFASYGKRVSGPKVGSIAVLSRGKRGGHVGVVTGVDQRGNPIIVSGNHGRRVAEAPYSRGKVIAYVMP